MLYCCPQESFAPGPIHTIKDTSGFKKKSPHNNLSHYFIMKKFETCFQNRKVGRFV